MEGKKSQTQHALQVLRHHSDVSPFMLTRHINAEEEHRSPIGVGGAFLRRKEDFAFLMVLTYVLVMMGVYLNSIRKIDMVEAFIPTKIMKKATS